MSGNTAADGKQRTGRGMTMKPKIIWQKTGFSKLAETGIRLSRVFSSSAPLYLLFPPENNTYKVIERKGPGYRDCVTTRCNTPGYPVVGNQKNAEKGYGATIRVEKDVGQSDLDAFLRCLSKDPDLQLIAATPQEQWL
jgi:hypothetical protein